MSHLKGLFLLCMITALIGCTHGMSLEKGQTHIDSGKHAIALLYVKVANQHKPEYQPNKLMVFVEGSGEKAYKTDVVYRSEQNRFNEYLVSFDMEPGTYTFNKIWLIYTGTFVGAHASIPLNMTAQIRDNAVVYLGHMEAVVRAKRNDNEPSAGPPLPAIDQAIAGFSTGTYDLKIEDRFAEDMKAFVSEYPGLAGVKIEKSILAP